jgi:hypothetical protein
MPGGNAKCRGRRKGTNCNILIQNGREKLAWHPQQWKKTQTNQLGIEIEDDRSGLLKK